MATNTEKIVVQVVVQGEKQLEKLERGTKRTTKNVGGLTKGLAGMTAGLVSAAAAFNQVNRVVGDAVKTFTKFEFEMAKVKAITGSTEKDFKKLTNTAQQLGRSTFFTASQVAELQVNFGKLGFSTQEILNAQEATLMLATATQSDLGRAAIVAGAAVRGFGLDAIETQRVVDVMAVAFTSSALDIEKFQTSMTKVAPISAAAGISIESTTAVMGTLTDAGIEASIAGTSLRNIFLKMQDPASDLSQHLGFTVENTADLEKALTQLNNEGLSNAEMMQLVDLRQVAAFQTMVSGADSVLDLTDALEDANGEAQKMADIMADTLQGDILKAKSAWEGLTLSIIGGKNNISRALRGLIQDWTQFLSTVVDNMRTPEQLGADFLTDSLNNIKNTQKEIDDLQKSGAPVETKTRAELLQLEIEALERKQEVQKMSLAVNEKEGEGIGAVAATHRQFAADLTNQIEARKLALKDLEEILEQEVKTEKHKNERIQLDIDIQNEKNRRKREREDRDKAKKDEEAAKQKFENEKTRINTEYQELENIHKQALIDEEITQATYDEAAFDMEQQRLEDMKNLLIEYGEDTSAINGKILDNELKMIADKAKAQADADAKSKKDRQEQIDGVSKLGQQLITLAGEDEKMQAIRKAGIQISAAAAIANNLLALSNAAVGVSEQSKLTFPFNIIAMLSTVATIMSLFANIKALKNSFGDGGVVEYANGGMVHGKSHANGGEKFAVGGRVVELEGGEAVINKRSTAMFRNQLSAMNSAGGGVKFADGGLLNMPSFSQQQFNALGQNQMMGAMGGSGKVVVVEADITDSQNTVSVLQAGATI
jgi:TP901 family phage tail tape measure protein